jgi:hypothetical protein
VFFLYILHFLYEFPPIFNKCLTNSGSPDSAVGIATGYGLDGRGVRAQVLIGSSIISSPRRPDRLWGPPSLLSNGYLGHFPGG